MEKLTKENIYLDLSKLSVEEIKEIPNILKKGNQELYFLAEKTIESGKLDNYYKHLVFAKATINIWVFSHYKPKRIEISLSEFRQLFAKGEEVLLVENKITRFEFITKENGREIVRYGEFTFQIQDNGKTLKVFQENKSNN